MHKPRYRINLVILLGKIYKEYAADAYPNVSVVYRNANIAIVAQLLPRAPVHQVTRFT